MSNTAYDSDTAYRLLLARKNRPGMPPPPALDEIWRLRILAAVEALGSQGITLNDSVDDAALVADYAVFLDESRDSSGMPEELRRRIRERWLKGDDGNA